MVLYILTDLISFLEIQRLQLAGSSSTVFAVNLILFYSLVPSLAEYVLLLLTGLLEYLRYYSGKYMRKSVVFFLIFEHHN